MDTRLSKINVRKLHRQLRFVRIASLVAIELGDARAVARLTCETARLMNAIALAAAVLLQ